MRALKRHLQNIEGVEIQVRSPERGAMNRLLRPGYARRGGTDTASIGRRSRSFSLAPTDNYVASGVTRDLSAHNPVPPAPSGCGEETGRISRKGVVIRDKAEPYRSELHGTTRRIYSLASPVVGALCPAFTRLSTRSPTLSSRNQSVSSVHKNCSPYRMLEISGYCAKRNSQDGVWKSFSVSVGKVELQPVRKGRTACTRALGVQNASFTFIFGEAKSLQFIHNKRYIGARSPER
ncbi:hypothetical protein WMY93_018395 [Mugilogobius chulae]|uniref:Uncharacterized protein n=1 Tax=Mugilogobius chulae TaxID=88201 RepID=A0AAW0NJ23_9GOBI